MQKKAEERWGKEKGVHNVRSNRTLKKSGGILAREWECRTTGTSRWSLGWSLLVFIDEDIGVVFQDSFNRLHVWLVRQVNIVKGIPKGQTLFCAEVSIIAGIPFIWPFAPGGLCPNNVGPKTIAMFCIDIAFWASFWTTLSVNKSKKLLVHNRKTDPVRTCVNGP